tara:strand:+ start:884 stop:1135 length:252 start_codon:yes stop_codon:yes gene_type:complete
MFIPKDILNIIYDYTKQLKIIKINKEYKEKVRYYYSSPHFSQINFNNKVISYYKGKDTVLCKIKNRNNHENGIYSDSIVSIIQ